MNLYTREEEIRDVRVGRPHVWILGAGASRAAFPTGDADGRSLPLMKDMVKLLGLAGDLRAADVQVDFEDFEAVFSYVAERERLAELRGTIESRVREYFTALRLPKRATLYDHLVCSLRGKDVIATFNWDPFLYDAMARNQPLGGDRLPKVLFLHGNVRVAYCEKCRVYGRVAGWCHKCSGSLTPSRLLFPVTKKDYNADPFTKAHWDRLRRALKDALVLTVFGYGAPQSDIEAIELMKGAWGGGANRAMEQTEMIDLLPEEVLLERWKPFVHSHHYDIEDDFYRTDAARHPRRSCEHFVTNTFDARWSDSEELLPRRASLPGLHEWLRARIAAEVATEDKA